MASSSPEKCGYDVIFTSEVPEYLKCIVCHLVLRQPIQIMKCGHRFCEPCFEQIKVYANRINTDLSCPIDKDLIDLNKVFEDTGMARIIGNLKVLCPNNESGCAWSDDLRDLLSHEEKCQYKVIEGLDVQRRSEVNSQQLGELHERMSKCEQGLIEKEKDVAILKFNMEELKTRFNESQTQVDLLTAQNMIFENAIKDILKKIKEFGEEERRVIRESTREAYELLSTATNAITNELEEREIDNSLLNIVKVPDAVINENQKTKKKKSKKKKSAKVPEEANGTTNVLNTSRSSKETKEQLLCSGSTLEAHSVPVPLTSRAQERLKGNVNILARLLNVQFAYKDYKTEDAICLYWTLENHRHHYNIGTEFYSPTFHTDMPAFAGIAFKLSIDWRKRDTTGEEEVVILSLRVLRGLDFDDTQKHFFECLFTLSIKNINGGDIMPFETRRNSFTIRRQIISDRFVVGGEGMTKILTDEAFLDYIGNDKLIICCEISQPKFDQLSLDQLDQLLLDGKLMQISCMH